jgi:IS5 family transposase
MLRIYFLHQWFNLSDPGVEEALYDMVSMRTFASIDLGDAPAHKLSADPEADGQLKFIWSPRKLELR